MGMRFEDLKAWQTARQLVRAVYGMVKHADLARDFGLRDQLQRAAVSVMTNIAEGFERTGVSEKAQFYKIARASCGEVRSLLYVVEDTLPTLAERVVELRGLSDDTGRLISGLINSTEKRKV